jgi:hypothetical protein
MHWILVAMLNLIFWQAPAAGEAKKPQAWDVNTIQWRDVPGEAFTYAFFLPAGYHEHHWHSSDARVVVVIRGAEGEFRRNSGSRTPQILSRRDVPARSS